MPLQGRFIQGVMKGYWADEAAKKSAGKPYMTAEYTWAMPRLRRNPIQAGQFHQ